MSTHGHNRLPVLKQQLVCIMEQLIARSANMYTIRAEVRAYSREYPEYIIWLPELRGDQVVVDIWDRSWEMRTCVVVSASQEIQNAPMW